MATAPKPATNGRTRTAHVHVFNPYPADTRFGFCKCGVTTYMQATASGEVAPVTSENPCVAQYGRGPAGATCAECCHLQRERASGRTRRKCARRVVRRGKGLDHAGKWEACGQFARVAVVAEPNA